MEKNHPLHSFSHCPSCGESTFVAQNEKAKHCESCGFTYYFNISAAVAGIIVNAKNELLVCRRAKNPVKGTLDLAGGFVDMNESAEQALAREIKEELNLDLLEHKYLFSLPNIYTYAGFDVHTLDIFFECTVKSFEGLHACDDVSEAIFISKEKLNTRDFGLASIQKGLQIYLNK